MLGIRSIKIMKRKLKLLLQNPDGCRLADMVKERSEKVEKEKQVQIPRRSQFGVY